MRAFNKIYISKPIIEQVHSDRKAANKIVLYSAMEGDIQETICHEIIHSLVNKKLGGKKQPIFLHGNKRDMLSTLQTFFQKVQTVHIALRIG